VILTLVREQVRAQRAALIWTALVVAAAVGFSTYASVVGATHAAIDEYRLALSPGQAPHGALVQLTDLGAQAQGIDDSSTPTTTAVLADQLAQSNAAGSDAWAAASTRWGAVATVNGQGSGSRAADIIVMATWGATPWDAILAEGRAPLAGEVAIPAGVARDLHVGIGDSVRLTQYGGAHTGPDVATQTISGLTYDVDGSQPWPEAPLYLNGADAALVAALDGMPGPPSDSITATVGWSTPGADLGTPSPAAWEVRSGPALMQTGAVAPWLVAITLTVGAVIMAFAVGRTQAAMRVQWTATARALGARRSHLLGAGAVEAAALFATSLVGVALGYAAALGEHAAWRHSLAAAPPVGVSLPSWLLAALVALAATLAVTSAAIPAVLATTIPPTAALKATAATDEQELSRRVRVLPVGLGLGVVWVLLLQPRLVSGTQLVPSVLALAGGVLLIAFVIEMTRRGAEAAGRRWQHSARPWQVYAGTMLGGHPRQAAALASIHFFALFGVAGALSVHGEGAIHVLSWLRVAPWLVGQLIASPYGLAVIAVLLAVATLCAAIIASSFKASAAERELAAALGLQPRDLRRAHAYTWAAAQAAGALVGAIAGTVLVGSILASKSANGALGFLSYEVSGRLVAFGASIGVALVAGLLAALLSVAVAMGSVRTTPSRTVRPVEVTS
jgi:hypothetical protein